MNYYHLPLLVIFLGPWLAANEIPHNSTQTSVKSLVKEEAKKKGNGEGWVVSPARASLESLRRSLKLIRKWCRSHPLEVKLARCFASYFNIKIPGLRRYDPVEEKNERRPTLNEDFLFFRSNFSLSRKFQATAPLLSIRVHYNTIIDTFKYYINSIKNNQLMLCFWDYIYKKFWIWIDTAPDS